MQGQDCKAFIGGLHLDTTSDSLLTFFEKYGDIVDAVVMRDNVTNKSRGFGFVTYRKPHMLEKCLAGRPHVVDGKDVSE